MKNMNYQLLGRSGLRVSDLCLGAMSASNGRLVDWGLMLNSLRPILILGKTRAQVK
jgi:hypothetical protein